MPSVKRSNSLPLAPPIPPAQQHRALPGQPVFNTKNTATAVPTPLSARRITAPPPLHRPVNRRASDIRQSLHRRKGQQVDTLRTLLARQWLYTAAPKLIRSLINQQDAQDHQISITLVVNGRRHRLAPLPPAAIQANPQLGKYIQQVKHSLFRFYKQHYPLARAEQHRIEQTQQRLKKLADRLSASDGSPDGRATLNHIAHNTRVAVDLGGVKGLRVWGEPATLSRPFKQPDTVGTAVTGRPSRFGTSNEEEESSWVFVKSPEQLPTSAKEDDSRALEQPSPTPPGGAHQSLSSAADPREQRQSRRMAEDDSVWQGWRQTD